MAVPFLMGVILDVRSWVHFTGAARREKRAEGVVIGHQTAYHESYEFLFQVAGQSYTGWHGNECKPDVLVVGQQIGVTYDPANPHISDLCSFAILIRNTIRSLLAELGAIIVLVALTLRKGKDEQKRIS
jgi:hypothetical protein